MEKVFSRLRRTDFEVRNIDVFHITFKEGSCVDYRAHGRKRHVLHYIASGKRSYEIGGRRLLLGCNTLILIPEGTQYITHSYAEDGVPCSGISVDFACDALFPNGEKALYYLENIQHGERVEEMFRAVHKAHSDAPLDVLAVKTALYNLLLYLCNSLEKKSGKRADLEPALAYLSETYAQNLPIKRYADRCNLSESYFRKKFASYMGMSPIEYRNKLRFTQAKNLYRQGFSTQEIAEKTGFCDAGNLLRTYRKTNGTSLKNDAQNV